MSDDVNDFLMAGGVTSAKFDQPGTAAKGTILHLEKQQQRDMDTGKPKVWDDGKPREQIVINIQTGVRDPAVEDDDGVRAVYVRGNMLKAVREALRKSGARLEVGGEITIVYTGDGERPRAGFNPPKLYAASYTPPAVVAAGDFIAAAPAPQQAFVPLATSMTTPVPAAARTANEAAIALDLSKLDAETIALLRQQGVIA